MTEYEYKPAEPQESLREIIYRDPDGKVVVDNKGRILYANPAFARLTGQNTDTLHGQLFGFPIIEGQSSEIEIASPEGGYGSAEMRAVQINWQGIPASLVSIRDITERKQAEEALKKSEEKYRELIENISDVVWTVDKNLNITYISPSIEQMVGETVENYMKRSLKEWLPPSSVEKLYSTISEVLEKEKDPNYDTKTPRVVELEHYLKDGSTIWGSMHVLPLRDKNGNIAGFQGITRNITERKKAEEALKLAAEEWRTTFDSITDMVAIIDTDRKIKRVNKAFARALGLTPQSIIGKTCYQVVHDLNEPHPSCTFDNTVGANKTCHHELFEPNMGKHLECAMSPLRNGHDDIAGVVHTFKDITRRKEVEAEQQALRDKAEVSSRLASVGEMAAGIAHEINNPLTSVLGFSELLLQEDLPPETQEHVKYIAEGSKRVKGIVKRMLTFARQTKHHKTSLDICELIDNTLEMRSYVLKTANIEVIKKYAPGLPCVTVDPGQLQQVFMNLIVNAEHAINKARDGGTLIITTEREDGTISISFTDNGTGMSKETLSKLFHPFFTTKEPGEGTGLGLSLSRSIILEHGGTIEVNNDFGKGTTFTIRLPVTQPAEAEKSEDSETQPKSKDVKPPKASILVVDDEPGVRDYTREVLAQAGYDVEVTGKPAETLEKLEASSYDAILMDIRMPGMSGKELYSDIKAKWPEMARRVVFITGDVSDASTDEFLKEHGLPYISKPFEQDALLEKVSELLRT